MDVGAMRHRVQELARSLAAAVGVRRRELTDPFTTLEVQLALTRLDREIARIRADDVSFARAHHLIAAQLAYGQALEEACRLAGVPSEDLELDLGELGSPSGPTAPTGAEPSPDAATGAGPGAPSAAPTPGRPPGPVATSDDDPFGPASRSGARRLLAEAYLRSRGWDW
jgi:hypothetical protein